MYLNKVILIGNLTRDPELKALPSGSKVAAIGVATNRVWRDKDGAKKEAVDFHNVVVFGRQAETSAQYLKKGSGILVEGRMQTRSWDGTDGQKRYRTEIVADRIQFGNRSGSFAAQNGSQNVNKAEPIDDSAPDKDAGPGGAIEYPEEEINPDDIPF